MTLVITLIKEQLKNINLIFSLAAYGIKGTYQMHYLGALWQILIPVSQILIYWFVFGLGIRGGSPVGETPYIIWMLCGLIPWFFISPSIIQGANSIYSKINLVSKMKFPVSILPTVTIVSNFFTFTIMLFGFTCLLWLNNIRPTIYLIQLPYYLVSLLIFLFSFTILASTISIIIRDFQSVLQSSMRMLFFLTPIFWEISALPEVYQTILKLNPFYYLIHGFRSTFLGYGWFYSDLIYTFYFWFVTLLLLFIGSLLHFKFRRKFVDFL